MRLSKMLFTSNASQHEINFKNDYTPVNSVSIEEYYLNY